MITKDIIKKLYKIHKKPVGYDAILPELNEFIYTLAPSHNMRIEGGNLVLDDVDKDSIFKTIQLDRICGIEPFDRNIALILPNSILFFNKENSGINLHIKLPKPSLMDRIKEKASSVFHS